MQLLKMALPAPCRVEFFKVTVCHTSLHLHPHIFTCSHLHLFASSPLNIFNIFFSSSHLHLFISSHHRQNLNLHVLTSPRHILKSSYHNIFFSSHPHLFTSSISFFSSYIFISSYLHTLYIIFYIFFFLRYLDIFLSLCFMLYHLLTYIFHYISLRSRAIRRLVVHHFESGKPVHFISNSLPFGASASVVGFNRISCMACSNGLLWDGGGRLL